MSPVAQGYYLKSIEFNDGTLIELQRNSIILLTGPNNCGKSRTIKEIVHHPVLNKNTLVTSKIDSVFEGSLRSVIDDLLRNPTLRQNRMIIDQTFLQSQGNPALFFTLIAQNAHLYRLLVEGVMTHLSTLTRLMSFGLAPENANVVNVQPFGLTSLVRLYEDEVVSSKVYECTKSAFGKGVVMNHAALNDSDLYIIDRENCPAPVERGTTAYARWFESLDKLNQQGDGVNSFSTILISLFQGLTPLVLLDEPEAFLHPPQIRELARVVACETPEQTQLIVATHSDDFVRGMIDFAGQRTSVVRMTRHKQNDREINKIKKLDASEISTLWNDPLLRTSDVLTSLFHQVAVIVEGDSDARFFRAMIDALAEEHHRSLDIKFFHCGGKDRIPRIASALRAIGVMVICVVDIDILDNKDKFGRLVQSFGGDPSAFVKPHEELLTFISQKRITLTGLTIKEEILRLFDEIDPHKALPEASLKKMIEVIKPASSWMAAKQSGERIFSGGAPFNMFQHTFDQAKKIGILINKVGELENYCRSLSSKRKGEWLSEVLLLDLKKDPNLKEAREFVFELLDLCKLASK